MGKFLPGQSGNPNGGRLHDPELRGIKRVTQNELKDLASLICRSDIEELRAIAQDPKVTVLQAMVASVAARIMQKGDMAALDVLLNRLIGKVKDEVEVTANKGPSVIFQIPDNGRKVNITETTESIPDPVSIKKD